MLFLKPYHYSADTPYTFPPGHCLINMRSGTPLVAVLTDWYCQYQSESLNIIADELNAVGYGVLCITARELGMSGFDSPKHFMCSSPYLEVNQLPFDGLIALSGTFGAGATSDDISLFLNEFNFPTISLGLELPDTSSVFCNQHVGMKNMMDHLLSGKSRKNFVFVRGFKDDAHSCEREEVFKQSLFEHGIALDSIQYVDGNFNSYTTFELVSELLSDNRAIDCIVAANDVMANSAARAVKAHNLSIPHDIAVCGYDDTTAATSHSPALTTVRQPLREMTKICVQILLDAIDNAEHPAGLQSPHATARVRYESVDSELIVRASTLTMADGGDRAELQNDTTLENTLEKALSGIDAPPGIGTKYVKLMLKTLHSGGNEFTAYTESLDSQSIDLYRHWWINLCNHLDSGLNHLPDLEPENILSVSSAIAKLRSKIWAVEKGRDSKADRLQNVQSKLQLAMSSSSTMDDILAAMSNWLNVIKPNRCFLIRYDNVGIAPALQAQVIHAFRSGGVSSNTHSAFDTKQILPQELTNELSEGLLVFAPIVAEGLLFGYLLIDPREMDQLHIDDAALSIGNAMRTLYHQNALQYQRDNLQAVSGELHQLANFDALTGLANRFQFQQHIEEITNNEATKHQFITLLHLNLDGFKMVNDSLGQNAGDVLLVTVANRIRDCIESMDGCTGFVSRLGGDEFTVLFSCDKEPHNSELLAMNILKRIETSMQLNGQTIEISASIGCASYPGDANDAEQLVKYADVAMYHAKKRGNTGVSVFNQSMINTGKDELIMTRDLRHAIANRELSLHYQPRINLKTGKICSAEALMRWFVPSDKGPVVRAYPDVFIALAEKTGLIAALDTFALHTACKQAADWVQNNTPLQVSVNVSVNQLQQDNFVSIVLDALSAYNLDPALLELEITETAAMTDVESNIMRLKQIKDAGIAVSIDDFGTGYSSLNYLKRLPVDYLKIDRSFIMDIDESSIENSADASIVRSIVALGKNMGFSLIAEGIETPVQHGFVSSLQCDQAQGYLYAKPLPAAEVTALLHDQMQGNTGAIESNRAA